MSVHEVQEYKNRQNIKMLRYYSREDLYYGIPCFDSMGPGRWSQKFRRHTLTVFSVQVLSTLKIDAIFSSEMLLPT